MTLNEIAFDIGNLLRGGIRSDDDLVDIRQIKYWIHTTRATLIHQRLAKNAMLSDATWQTIPCAELEFVSASLCCNLDDDCIVARTKLDIPDGIHNKFAVYYPTFKGSSISIISYNRVRWVGNNKYTKDMKRAFFYNNKMYILNPDPAMKYISIEGIFEDPTKLEIFDLNCDSSTSTSPCYTDDLPYPMPNEMINTMKRMIIDTEFRFSSRALIDSTNDASGNLEEPGTK